MKRVIFKIIISVIAFVATIFLCQFVMNRDNVNTTRNMEKASLPVVYMNINGEEVNTLYGYTSEMNVALMRDSITPLDESRGVTFRVEKKGARVNRINIKVRTADGERLVENTDIEDYSEDAYSITVFAKLKDLLEEYTEYSLQIYLLVDGSKEVMYQTRVVLAPKYCTNEKLAFVKNFVEKEASTETNSELKEWMESNYLGDNTTLATVNIHSSLAQLAYGDLEVTRETKPVITIREIASETGIFLVNYLVSTTENEIKTYYLVEEYFRIKYSPEVTYLLDYNRTMHEITENEKDAVRSQDMVLGIVDSDIDMVESDDGNIVVFCNENRLYSYNNNTSGLVRLFSFYDKDNFDERTYLSRHKIKPLRVDEAGNVWFAVYGYLNRGAYEGRVGVILYYFNGMTNLIEEQFFIPYEQPAEMLMLDMGELSYLSNDGILYVMLDKNIYAIDVNEKSSEIMVSNLEENKYTVSADSSFVVWTEAENVNAGEVIKMMNLNTKQISEIKAPEGQYIKPLTFIGEDFAYGLANKEDVITDSAGRTTFPMHTIRILSRFGEVMKQYGEEGVYVTDIQVEDSLLTLKRVTKSTKRAGEYVAADNDYITNNKEKAETSNYVSAFENGPYQKVVRIIFKETVKNKVVLTIPKEVIYEGSGELILDSPRNNINYYYVYYKGRLQAIYTKEANAVDKANSNYGDVVNRYGYYVWYRANRQTRNQIMDLSKSARPKGEEEINILADCIDNMLEYAGVVRNSEYLLNNGYTVLSILNEALEGKNVLNLTGCSLDSILYYVNRDIPVLALLNDGSAKLVIGYNNLAVVVYDPIKGTYKLGRKEAESLFSSNGNQFITYVPNS